MALSMKYFRTAARRPRPSYIESVPGSVAWQSSVAVVIGVVAGRFLWGLFATSIYAVPSPTVPALAIVAIAFGPGRFAARTPATLLLRAE